MDDVAILLDRVDVVVECDQRRRIDGEALEFLVEVERLAAIREPLPARLDTTGDGREVLVLLAQVSLRERMHGERALPTPRLAFGREDAVDAELREDAAEPGRAAEPARPVTQDLLAKLRVRNRGHGLSAQAEAVHRTVFGGPSLQHEVNVLRLDLMNVPEQGKSLGAGQIGNLAIGLGARTRRQGRRRREIG